MLRWILGLTAAAFLAAISWSMLTETLLPLARAGAYFELALNCLGLPVILAGTAAFVWGGWRFLIGNAGVMYGDETFAERAIRLRDRETGPAVRRQLEGQQLGALWRAWRPGLAWLAVGGGLIAAGSVVINWLPAALGLR